MTRPLSRQRGFTLIELALVIAVAGLMLGGALYGLETRDENNRQRETENKIRAVEDGLTWYVQTYARLPCPDTNDDGTENRACPAGVGGVPFADIDLSRSDIIDGWGRDFRYVVPQTLTEDDALICTDQKLRTADSPIDLDGLTLADVSRPAYLVISHSANGTDDASANAQANITNTSYTNTFYENSTQTGFDEMVAYRSPGKVLIDTGCQIAVSDPQGMPTTPAKKKDEAPCVPNVFGDGMSSTGDGGIELKGNPSLNSLPSNTLTTTTLDKPNNGFDQYTASGTAGQTITIPSAPANTSTEDYEAGPWPDVHRTLTASGDYKSIEVSSSGSLTIESADDKTVVLNIKDDLTIGGASQMIINSNTVIYADDFEIGGSGGLVINNDATLTVILSGDLELKGSATLNGNNGASSKNLVVLAQGSAEFKGSTKASGYIYSSGKMELDGNVSVEGSVVGNSIEVKGSSTFTYSDAAASNISDNCS